MPRISKKRLLEEQQTFIVLNLACFRTPKEVSKLYQEKFGEEIDIDKVRYYDAASNWHNAECGEKWRNLFNETRAHFIEKTSDIAVMNQSYRLRVLQERLDKQIDSSKPNDGLILSILEQAAKEAGGHYTNRRELTGANGKPIETVNFTLDQWKEQAAEREKEAEDTMRMFEDAQSELSEASNE